MSKEQEMFSLIDEFIDGESEILNEGDGFLYNQTWTTGLETGMLIYILGHLERTFFRIFWLFSYLKKI